MKDWMVSALADQKKIELQNYSNKCAELGDMIIRSEVLDEQINKLMDERHKLDKEVDKLKNELLELRLTIWKTV